MRIILVLLLTFLGLLTADQSPTLCKSVVQDDTATVTMGTDAVINVDNTSFVSYGRNCQVTLQNGAKQNLKIQSGFRVLKSAICNIGERTNISYTESSHLTVGGRLDLCRDISFNFDASRCLIMGKADFQAQCKIDMYDSSVFRVYEGGSLLVNPTCSVEMARGSWFEVSEWWQHAELDDVKAQTTIGETCKISLADRSNFQVAKGSFFAQSKVTIKLDIQASFVLKGDMNVTESSNIIMGCQSKVYIGTPLRAYDPQAAPCLLFTKKGMTLEIGEHGSLIIQPGAHCMLVDSVKINDTVTLTAASKDKPYVGCFASSSELSSAMSSIPASRR